MNEHVVDLGNNTRQLIEQLANTIGVTVDKLFPWYVTQMIIEGWVALFAMIVVIAIAAIFAIKSYPKADFDDGNRYAVVFLASIVIAGGVLVAFFASTSYNVTKIINPQYHAVKELLLHARGRLR